MKKEKKNNELIQLSFHYRRIQTFFETLIDHTNENLAVHRYYSFNEMNYSLHEYILNISQLLKLKH